MTGFDTDDPQPVGEVTVAELRAIASSEELPAGSMRPKVQAVTRFAERTGGTGVITSLCRIADAVDGTAGTRVSR
jgi:carbamate kinase